ncbi:MAG: hypothetical protein IIX98_06180 [Clostridia bacterium]|nr:hypothetical protein [Clostridia bacterium]
MMNNSRKSIIEKIVFNNKALMIFSVIVAILIWATVKINYSDEVTRTLTGVKVNITATVDPESELVAFIDESELYCEVEVKGKSYDINSYALNKDEIIVEASGNFIDSAGNKELTLTAKTADGGIADVEFGKITPSVISVYYDRETHDTFNVEAKLSNDLATLTEGDYAVGQPVASMNTVKVIGPAGVLKTLKKVYFTASIKDDALPLTATKNIPAKISFDIENEEEARYLICEGINNESNPATVTVPVYVTKEVETGVKFVKQPNSFTESVKGVKISPDKVKISYNPQESEQFDKLDIGTIDFSEISNKVNYFEFPVDEKLGVTLTDKTLQKFDVSVDMSDMQSKTLKKAPTKIVYLNQSENYNYSVDFENSSLDEIVIIGPAESLKKIDEDDIQVEINVSSLSVNSRIVQRVKVNNISIQSDEVDDCWVYGEYEAVLTINAK